MYKNKDQRKMVDSALNDYAYTLEGDEISLDDVMEDLEHQRFLKFIQDKYGMRDSTKDVRDEM